MGSLYVTEVGYLITQGSAAEAYELLKARGYLSDRAESEPGRAIAHMEQVSAAFLASGKANQFGPEQWHDVAAALEESGYLSERGLTRGKRFVNRDGTEIPREEIERILRGASASWVPFQRGTTIGQIGFEGGVILREERHTDGARIALERVTKKRLFRSPIVTFAITCGIYGWMVHTRFFETEHEAQLQYDAMKVDISTIIGKLPFENDPVDQKMNNVPTLLHGFIEKYP